MELADGGRGALVGAGLPEATEVEGSTTAAGHHHAAQTRRDEHDHHEKAVVVLPLPLGSIWTAGALRLPGCPLRARLSL